MTGPLNNERWERFAQELAKGELQKTAYAKAGYRGDEAAASKLADKPAIRGRVAEILRRAAAKTELTVASITTRLITLADKGEKLGEASGLGVARAALMDAAKLNGLIVEKTKTEITNPDGSLRPTVIRIVAADDRSSNSASS